MNPSHPTQKTYTALVVAGGLALLAACGNNVSLGTQNMDSGATGTGGITGSGGDAAVGTGMYPGFEEAVTAMVRKGQTFQPDPQHHHIYTQLFNDVYKKSFRTLAPMYNRIAEMIG